MLRIFDRLEIDRGQIYARRPQQTHFEAVPALQGARSLAPEPMEMALNGSPGKSGIRNGVKP